GRPLGLGDVGCAHRDGHRRSPCAAAVGSAPVGARSWIAANTASAITRLLYGEAWPTNGSVLNRSGAKDAWARSTIRSRARSGRVRRRATNGVGVAAAAGVTQLAG